MDSELYSLADFPEIKYDTTKIYEFYMKGFWEALRLSRPKRNLRKKFVIFCEGDTEYNYIDAMRLKQG